MKIFKSVVICAVSFSLYNCAAPQSKSYVDPKYQAVEFAQINSVEEKHPVNIEVEFQRNGELLPAAKEELRQNVEAYFDQSGVVLLSEQDEPLKIKVTCNNIADLDAAKKKGFGAGLSLGLAGTTVSDLYEVKIELVNKDGVIKKSFEHAIHTTIGNKEAPFEGAQPLSLPEAFGGVIEDVVIQFIIDLQKQNILTLENRSKPFA